MSIRKGQVVLRDDKLFSYIVFPRYGSYVCDNCFKMAETLHNCAKCHLVYYCDRECQLEAWRSHHSLECRVSINFLIVDLFVIPFHHWMSMLYYDFSYSSTLGIFWNGSIQKAKEVNIVRKDDLKLQIFHGLTLSSNQHSGKDSYCC